MSTVAMSDALKAFLEKSKIKSGVKALQIQDAWEAIMGKTIAKYTDKIQVINKTLWVYTEIGPLRQELSYQKKTIIARINEKMGAGTIEDVIIK